MPRAGELPSVGLSYEDTAAVAASFDAARGTPVVIAVGRAAGEVPAFDAAAAGIPPLRIVSPERAEWWRDDCPGLRAARERGFDARAHDDAIVVLWPLANETFSVGFRTAMVRFHCFKALDGVDTRPRWLRRAFPRLSTASLHLYLDGVELTDERRDAIVRTWYWTHRDLHLQGARPERPRRYPRSSSKAADWGSIALGAAFYVAGFRWPKLLGPAAYFGRSCLGGIALWTLLWAWVA